MSESWRRAVSGAFLFCAVLSAAIAAETATPRFAGRPVAQALVELRRPGLDFLFSSELVPDSMRVVAEPRSVDPLQAAREILAPHGLALSPLRPGLYAVVAAPPAAAGPGRREPVSGETPAPLPRVPLDEIVVSTSRYTFDRTGGFGAIHIEGDNIEAQPVIGEDAIRSFGRLPGVTQSGLSAQSSVRGGEEAEVLTLLDGFPLRQPFHLPGYQSPFGVLDPSLIANAEVFTGGFPVRYGNRMAGVFDLHTIDATDSPATALGLSVFNAMARRGGEARGFDADWLAAARLGTLKPFIDWFAHDAGSPRYADVYARAGHGDTDTLRITANVLWSRDELAIAREDRNERAQIESRARYLWLRADRDFGETVRGSLWMGHSRVDSFRAGSLDDPDIAIGSVRDRRASTYKEVRGRANWQAGAGHWLEGGFELVLEDANYDYSADATYSAPVAVLFGRDESLTRSADLHPSRERAALFAAHRWQITDSLISEVGVRAQGTGGTDSEDWLLDPRVNLSWQFAPRTSVRAHAGRFRQADDVHELKVEDGLGSFPEPQRSDHVILGMDHRFAGGPFIRLEVFRKLQSDPRPHFENLLDPLSVIPEIAPDRVEVAPLAADIHGAEISLASQGPALDWWLALAWSEALDSLDGRHVPRSWDQTWSISGGVDWRRGPWRYGAYGVVRRGWPTTRLEGDALGERNASRFPVRAALDLRVEYRHLLAMGQLAITAELSNALNRGNECCRELVVEKDGAGDASFRARTSDWLPLVPSLGVLWEF
jgi:hypothetical protein